MVGRHVNAELTLEVESVGIDDVGKCVWRYTLADTKTGGIVYRGEDLRTLVRGSEITSTDAEKALETLASFLAYYADNQEEAPDMHEMLRPYDVEGLWMELQPFGDD